MYFDVSVTSDDEGHIAQAVQLCMAHPICSRKEVTHTLSQKGRLVLLSIQQGEDRYWGPKEQGDVLHPLPFPLKSVEVITEFLRSWLDADTSIPPDSDWPGEDLVKEGWTITSGVHYMQVLDIKKAWVGYGK